MARSLRQWYIYMTTASFWRVCWIFRNCVSTAEFLHYWSRQAVYDKVALSLSNWYRVKAISITYSECASVALVIQHAHHIFSYRIALSSVTHRILPYLLTLSHKRHKLWNRFFELFLCFDFSCKFVDRFSKNPQISKIIKILTVGAELFHADRRMDGWMDKQTWRS